MVIWRRGGVQPLRRLLLGGVQCGSGGRGVPGVHPGDDISRADTDVPAAPEAPGAVTLRDPLTGGADGYLDELGELVQGQEAVWVIAETCGGDGVCHAGQSSPSAADMGPSMAYMNARRVN